ncbi:MAG TPA: hypothetical protein ACFYEF_00180 [Candidatus Wunengus sp. YC63]|uniref:hypothetical protein n=1 Tax=Candidatus Wunengus sp. YC63 TaxID=3367699 RepID=UPI004026E01E
MNAQTISMEYNCQTLSYPLIINDSGRSNSKRSKQTNDCTVRALSNILDIDYDIAYDYLASRGRKSSTGTFFPNKAKDDHCFNHKFVWRAFPAIRGEMRMNPAKFSEQYKTGRFIVKTAKHVIAVRDGVFFDIFASRPNRCIYGA